MKWLGLAWMSIAIVCVACSGGLGGSGDGGGGSGGGGASGRDGGGGDAAARSMSRPPRRCRTFRGRPGWSSSTARTPPSSSVFQPRATWTIRDRASPGSRARARRTARPSRTRSPPPRSPSIRRATSGWSGSSIRPSASAARRWQRWTEATTWFASTPTAAKVPATRSRAPATPTFETPSPIHRATSTSSAASRARTSRRWRVCSSRSSRPRAWRSGTASSPARAPRPAPPTSPSRPAVTSSSSVSTARRCSSAPPSPSRSPRPSLDSGFVAALDPNTGAAKSALRFGGTDFDLGNSIEVTSAGLLRVAGLVSGAATIGGLDVQAAAMGSPFVAELTAAGTANWVRLIKVRASSSRRTPTTPDTPSRPATSATRSRKPSSPTSSGALRRSRCAPPSPTTRTGPSSSRPIGTAACG